MAAPPSLPAIRWVWCSRAAALAQSATAFLIPLLFRPTSSSFSSIFSQTRGTPVGRINKMAGNVRQKARNPFTCSDTTITPGLSYT